MARSIGTDQVIDYTQEDFTKNGQRYDLILDIVVNRSVSDYMRALSPKGNYVVIAFLIIISLTFVDICTFYFQRRDSEFHITQYIRRCDRSP